MQQKKNTTLTTSTANGRAAHTIPTLMKRITMMLALIVSFALGARAASYTISSGNNYLGINNGAIANISPYNAANCVWTGPESGSGRFSMTVNGTTYYLLYYNGLTVTTYQNYATNWTINGERLYTGTRYIRYNNGWTTANNPNNSTSGLDILAKVTYKDPTEITAEGVEILVGEEGQITYELTSTSGTPVYDNVTFSINNTGIASINATTGVVTGVSAGTATVTVTAKKQNGTTACTATCNVVVKEPVTLEYVFYYNGYYLAINDNGTDIEPVAEFDPETCIWRGVETGTGVYSATVDGTTYYLQLPSNSDFAITTNIDQATRWTRNGNKLYSTGNRYVRYNNSWTTTSTSTREGTDVLYPITKISEGTPTTTVEYTVGNTTVSPTAAAVDYGKSQQFTANASVTKTTTTTKTDTYQHSSSTGNTIQPKPSVSSTSSETLSPTGYDWSLSSTDNLTLGTGTASTNSVTYSTASGTTKNVTLNVTAYYMDGTSKKQGTAGTATITVNEKKDDPTGITAEDLTLAVDEQKSISYTLTPSNAYDNIAYSGNYNGIISIDANGVVKGLKAGITTVTLTAKNQNGTNSAHSATSTVTVMPNAPTIEFSLGANITATISTTETGAKIYYTTDGTTPTTSSSEYTAPVSVTAGATVKAIVVVTANGTQLTSPVAEALANAESGIVGNTVFLYDLEDHNWTYYSGVNTSVDGGNYNDNYVGKLYSPNPRNVKITYNANGGAVSIDESETSFVYFKTLEQGATAGQYPYTVISNPFSKRPTGKGFGGWKIISGGEYINGYNNGSTLPLDQEITFVNLPYPSTNCISAEIVLEATWVNAQVTYLATVNNNNYDYTFNVTNGSSTTYENNFLVINRSYSGTLTLSQPVTIMMVEPNATGADPDYRDNYTFTGDITPNNTGVTKIEFAKWESSKTITADYHNLWIGRGVAASGNNNCASLINGGSTTSTESPRFHVKVESGKYNYMSLLSGYYTNSGGNGGYGFSITGTKTNAKITLGNDYDRAKGDNTALQFVYGISMGRSGSFSNSGNRDNTQVLDFTIKSGRIGYTFFMENTESTNYLQGGAGYCIYLSSGGSQTNVGTRNVLIEGGDICTIGSGIDSYNNAPSNSTTASTTTNYNRLGFNVRIKGGTIHGNVYGGAAKSPAGGNRVMIMTGGQVKGWFAAGCNGTDDAGGQTYGTSYVYIGGTAKVDSEGSTKTLGYANGGNVYAAGAGRQNSTTCGEMTFGTNLVIADKSYIERGAYGGGNYGYAATSSSTKIYVTGGINEGNNGTVNSVTTKGGVYGGANQQNGPNVGIYMTGGEMRGGLYGGSNTTGTISGNVTIQINGGQVGTSSKPANIHGGGYGQSTIVTGNVNLTLGTSDQTSEGVTVWGDVYGGSALGKVNCTVNNYNNYQYTNNTETNVTLYKGTINGSLYGGALGGSNVGTHVYGPVKVKVYGGSVKKTSADGSGGVYGANNKDGAPQRSVTVDIYGTDPAPSNEEYALYAVYGGGNQAPYTYGNGYPKVTVHDCDNSIEYVYGGGNAAAVAATDVTIWGGNVIGNVFGGGNGTVSAANVTGSTSTTIYGGTILNVYGGSNSQGTIGGDINLLVNSQAEEGKDLCLMNIVNVFGGGNQAASKAGNISIVCTGDNGYIENVYGGANQANITGDIDLYINGGNIGNVFGGNNESGNISGNITVTVGNAPNEDCGIFEIGNVYGGGNLAAYSNGNGYPIVNMQGGTVRKAIFGGGYGVSATVTGNPQVNVSGGIVGSVVTNDGTQTILGDIYGGGNMAPLIGNPVVTLSNNANVWSRVFGGGNNALVTGKTNVTMSGGVVGYTEKVGEQDVVRGGDIFGGGNAATIEGETNVHITKGRIGHNVYGGGNEGNVTGKTNVKVGE